MRNAILVALALALLYGTRARWACALITLGSACLPDVDPPPHMADDFRAALGIARELRLSRCPL